MIISDSLRRNRVSRAADLDAVDACILSRCGQGALIRVNPRRGQRALGRAFSDLFATGIAYEGNLDYCFAAAHRDMQTPGSVADPHERRLAGIRFFSLLRPETALR